MVRTDVNICIYGTREKTYPVLRRIKKFLEELEAETRGEKPTVTHSMHKVIYYSDSYFEK